MLERSIQWLANFVYNRCKQSSLYIAELLSDADTVSISETWLRPGELCIIKPTLINTPALNVLNDEDIVTLLAF